MKAIIMAAGKTGVDSADDSYGGFPTNCKPKCLLKMERNGKPILERNVKLLRKHGIEDIIVVVGYQASLITEFVKKRKLNLKLVYNPNYASAGATQSLLLALDQVEDNEEAIIMILGDVLINNAIVTKLIEADSDICVTVNISNAAELYLAKFTKNSLGDLHEMEKWIMSMGVHERGKFLAFCQHLKNLGAKEVQPSKPHVNLIREIDEWFRVARFNREEEK